MTDPAIRLLLVEDNPEDAALIREALGDGGDFACVLESAGRLDEGVAALAASAFDAVLLDPGLPDASGLDAVRALQAAAEGLPLLVLTGVGDEAVAIDALQCGAHDYLVKGQIDPRGLVRAIRYALERTRAERERQRVERGHRLLIEAGRVLASSLDYESTLRSLATLPVPALAEWCVIDVLDDEGSIQVVGRAGTGEPESELRRYPRAVGAEQHPVWRVLRTGRPRLFTRVPPGLLGRILHGAGPVQGPGRRTPRAVMMVPMNAHGRMMGVITLAVFQRGRSFDRQDLELAEELARQAALEVENARLFRSAQEAQFRAEQAARVRDEVVGFVAHDLRSPLSAITMYASMLLDALGQDEPHRRRLQAIQKSTARMDHLIQDLLDVTRIEAGRLRVEPHPVEGAPLLREAAALMESLAEADGIDLEAEVCGPVPGVLADRERLLQVFSNLVGNALKFTPRGGRVILRAEGEAGGVRFSVVDTGSGIAPEDLPHVFDRFWQARSGRGGGAGLGLSIVRGIVEAHRGHIHVESELGRGTAIHFWVPAPPAAAADAAVEVPEPDVPPAAAPVRIRVLLVDDHPVIRRGLAELLRQSPRVDVVGQAATGEEAVAKTRAQEPDVVVMDLAMPGIGGIEAIRRICSGEGGSRVLALTADTEEESLLPVLQAGGSGYVRKTTAHQDLVRAIEVVARGEVFLYPSASRLLLTSYRQMAQRVTPDPLRGLTETERTILTLTAEGYTSAEIGRRLFLSPSTVDTHRSKLMCKLGLGHRSELVRFAVSTGLLRAEA